MPHGESLRRPQPAADVTMRLYGKSRARTPFSANVEPPDTP